MLADVLLKWLVDTTILARRSRQGAFTAYFDDTARVFQRHGSIKLGSRDKVGRSGNDLPNPTYSNPIHTGYHHIAYRNNNVCRSRKCCESTAR